jgi:hypothetical protein
MLQLILAVALLAQDAPPRVLPEGTSAERTAAALRGGVVAKALALPASGSAEAWKGWAADLERARGAKDPDPACEARLASFALEQQRWNEAWAHFARTGGEPALAAALLPRFLPGVAADAPLEKDGFAGALPDGVTLRPALPPAKGDAPRGRIERREMKLARLAVGKGVISLRVAVEYDGITVELAHVSGAACKVAVVLPCEPAFRLANEYVDWYVQETHGAPLALELKPGEEAHTLYGRIDLRPVLGPERVPEELPALAARDGLVLELFPGDAGEALVRAIAESFAAPPLSLSARVWTRGASAVPAGLRIDLTRPDERAQRLSDLAAAIERFVLAPKR